jgi:hypothetical protein
MTFQLYIGSNNKTHQLELVKIRRIIAERHQGFTLYRATGYWIGKPEATAVVVIDDAKSKVLETIAILKAELSQDAIAYQQAAALKFA